MKKKGNPTFMEIYKGKGGVESGPVNDPKTPLSSVQSRQDTYQRSQASLGILKPLLVTSLVVLLLAGSFYAGSLIGSRNVYSVKLHTVTFQNDDERSIRMSLFEKISAKLREHGYSISWIKLENNTISLYLGRYTQQSEEELTKIKGLKLEIGDKVIGFKDASFVNLN